jgi:RNA polymerase sigma-70 factor, ECF subfamily
MQILRLATSATGTNFDLGAPFERGNIEKLGAPDDREYLIQLFREVRTPLYSYLVCIGLKPHEADDIVQEAFLRLYRQLQSGARIEEPRAWLFRVARNASLNVQRSRRKWVFETELSPAEGRVLEQRSSPEGTPEQVYLKKEEMKLLDVRMGELTEQQRQCVYLRAQGLRYREIASVLGVTISSAAELLQRAIVRLAGGTHG